MGRTLVQLRPNRPKKPVKRKRHFKAATLSTLGPRIEEDSMPRPKMKFTTKAQSTGSQISMLPRPILRKATKIVVGPDHKAQSQRISRVHRSIMFNHTEASDVSKLLLGRRKQIKRRALGLDEESLKKRQKKKSGKTTSGKTSDKNTANTCSINGANRARTAHTALNNGYPDPRSNWPKMPIDYLSTTTRGGGADRRRKDPPPLPQAYQLRSRATMVQTEAQEHREFEQIPPEIPDPAKVQEIVLFEDLFETYALGSRIVEQNTSWLGWVDSEHRASSDSAQIVGFPEIRPYFGGKCLKINKDLRYQGFSLYPHHRNQQSHLVYQLGPLTTGSFWIELWHYLPTNQAGALGLLSQYPLGQIRNLRLILGAERGFLEGKNADFEVIRDRWVPIQIWIDLDQDVLAVYYNQTFVGSYPYTEGVTRLGSKQTLKQLVALDFESWEGNTCYYDHLVIKQWRAKESATKET